MMAQAGFTLIEALAAGIISTVLAGAILSLLYMANGQYQDGASQFRLQTNRNAVSEQIRKSVQGSYGAMEASEDTNAIHNDDVAKVIDAARLGFHDGIRFFDKDYKLVAGFQLGHDYLIESSIDPATGVASWIPFMIGDDTVHLDSANSTFGYLRGRKIAVLDLRLTNGSDSLTHHEIVQCRNRN